MATDVDICNLALANLGDTATVASIDPPEGSVQAELCARFYPIARNELLEMHTWGFSMRRVQLALLTSETSSWAYAYAQPADLLTVVSLLPYGATDDYSSNGAYVPVTFESEVDSTGANIILTNTENAVLRYTALVSDPAKFPPLFVAALSWLLSSKLAGPILKGKEGAEEAKRCLQMSQVYLARAIDSDLGDRKTAITHNVAWIASR